MGGVIVVYGQGNSTASSFDSTQPMLFSYDRFIKDFGLIIKKVKGVGRNVSATKGKLF